MDIQPPSCRLECKSIFALLEDESSWVNGFGTLEYRRMNDRKRSKKENLLFINTILQMLDGLFQSQMVGFLHYVSSFVIKDQSLTV